MQIGRIFYSPTGKKKISDCPAWNNYDKLTQSFFAVMGQVENSFSCSGICVTGNLSIAHDSTNS